MTAEIPGHRDSPLLPRYQVNHTSTITIVQYTTVMAKKQSLISSFLKRKMDTIGLDQPQAKIMNQTTREFVVLHENINPTWLKALNNEFKKPYYKKVCINFCFIIV